MRIALTGANGKLGAVVETYLREHNHDVVAMDVAGPKRDGFVRVDLTDYGQVVDALGGIDERHSGLDAVVNLAAIPAPGIATDIATLHNNLLTGTHVLHAARRMGIPRVVFASSETLLGLPLEIDPPYIPIDERFDSRPESMYSLGKHLEEEFARKLARWIPDASLTALRFSNVMTPDDYPAFEDFQNDTAQRRWNLWGYIDARDGAQAVERALLAERPGFEKYIIAAADTVMRQSSATLVEEHFPNVERWKDVSGNETLLSIDKARDEIGYEPQHSWR